MNKRYTNRFIEPVVQRFSDYAVVEHVGRRSGTHYRTPVFLFNGDSSFLVALTYGPSADWAQNVLAGENATLHYQDREIAITSAQVVGRDEAWPHLPAVTRAGLRALGVHDFMQLRAGAG